MKISHKMPKMTQKLHFFTKIWSRILIKSKVEPKNCAKTEVFYVVKFWSLGQS